VHSLLRKAAFFTLAWLAVACIGYGLALRQYGEKLRDAAAPGEPAVTEGNLRAFEGKIAFLTVGFPRSSGVKLRLEGVDTLFYLPANLLTDEKSWSDLIKLGVPGAKAALKADPQGAIVRELRLNPGTVYQKEILGAAAGLRATPENEGRRLGRMGLLWLAAGLALVAAAVSVTPVGADWIRFRLRLARP
jgi:hypothetical protein